MILANIANRAAGEAIKVAMEDDWLTYAARGVYVWLLHWPDTTATLGELASAGPPGSGPEEQFQAVQLLEEYGYVTVYDGRVRAILP
jgi:hypothetical protein